MKFSGILHVHSAYSYDGETDLAELRVLAERAGLQFICVTEHTEQLSAERAQAFIRECRERSDDSFLFIPGFEVPNSGAHLLLLGAHEYPITGQGLMVIAHPHRNGFIFDAQIQERCVGAEVWNSQYDGKRFPRWAALAWFRRIVRVRPEFRALAGVDLHRPSHLKGPRLVIDADALTEEQVLHAIREGRYRLGSKRCALDAQGRIIHPRPAVVWCGSMWDILLIRCARVGSRIIKRLGWYRYPLVRRIRERMRHPL